MSQIKDVSVTYVCCARVACCVCEASHVWLASFTEVNGMEQSLGLVTTRETQ